MLAHDASTAPSNTCDTPGDLSTFATAEAGALSLRRSALVAGPEVSGVHARMTRDIRATSRTEFAKRSAALQVHATTGSQALAAQGAFAVLWHGHSTAGGFVQLTGPEVATVLEIDARTWHEYAGLLEAAGLLRQCGAGYEVPWSPALEGTTTARGTSGFLQTSTAAYGAVLARVRRAAQLDGHGSTYVLAALGALEVLRVTKANWATGRARWTVAAAATECSVRPGTWAGYLTLLGRALVIDRDSTRIRVLGWQRWQVAPSTQQTATSASADAIDAPDIDEPAALAQLLRSVGWLPDMPSVDTACTTVAGADDLHEPSAPVDNDLHEPSDTDGVKALAFEVNASPLTPPRSRGTEAQKAGQDFDHQTKTAPAVRKQRPSREPRRPNECRVASQALQARVPVLGRASTTHVCTRIREFVLAGWSVADVVIAMDRKPDGALWPHDGAHGVGNVGGWLRYRLAAWRDEAGTVTLSTSQRAQARVDAATGRAAARHEQQRAASAARPTMDSAVVGDALAEMRCVAARSRAARLARLYA
jgi:hypothetical protein